MANLVVHLEQKLALEEVLVIEKKLGCLMTIEIDIQHLVDSVLNLASQDFDPITFGLPFLHARFELLANLLQAFDFLVGFYLGMLPSIFQSMHHKVLLEL